MLLLLYVWLTVRGVLPCVGEGGVLAVVLLGVTSIQAPKDFFRSLKTPLSSWPSCPAKRHNLTYKPCSACVPPKWWLCVEGALEPKTPPQASQAASGAAVLLQNPQSSLNHWSCCIWCGVWENLFLYCIMSSFSSPGCSPGFQSLSQWVCKCFT